RRARDRDDHPDVPVVGGGEWLGERIDAIGALATMPFDETAEDRARRGTRAAPRERGELRGVERPASGAARRQRQRGERRGRGREADPTRYRAPHDDRRGLAAAGGRADEVEEAREPPRLVARGLRAVDHEPVFVAGAEADVRLDVEPLERERDAPRRGE